MTVTETQPAEVGDIPPSSTYEPGVGLLAAALAAVQLELPAIRKAETGEVSGTNKDGKYFSYKYSYAGLGAVSAAIMPLLGKNGLAFTSWPTRTTQGLVLRYYLLHESGQRLDGEYPLPSGNVTAQQLGSAITYARRYCLCAVTGVAPDDDDDAAAADGAKAEQRAEVQAQATAEQAAAEAQYAAERTHGIDAIRGAWANHFGVFDGAAAAEMFKTWSKGGTVEQATPAQLRTFAGYLLALPTADAGSDPTTPPPSSDPEARTEKLSRKDNAHIFVLFEKLGMKDDTLRQREYLASVLEREIKSRSDVMQADAPKVLAALQADVEEAKRTGLAPQTVSGSAAGAQSASGETRVPAGPGTPQDGS